jgi:Chitin recognition protein
MDNPLFLDQNVGQAVAPVAQPTVDWGACGSSKLGISCSGFTCCSRFGYCGVGPDYCEAGCQSSYGYCWNDFPPDLLRIFVEVKLKLDAPTQTDIDFSNEYITMNNPKTVHDGHSQTPVDIDEIMRLIRERCSSGQPGCTGFPEFEASLVGRGITPGSTLYPACKRFETDPRCGFWSGTYEVDPSKCKIDLYGDFVNLGERDALFHAMEQVLRKVYAVPSKDTFKRCTAELHEDPRKPGDFRKWPVCIETEEHPLYNMPKRIIISIRRKDGLNLLPGSRLSITFGCTEVKVENGGCGTISKYFGLGAQIAAFIPKVGPALSFFLGVVEIFCS